MSDHDFDKPLINNSEISDENRTKKISNRLKKDLTILSAENSRLHKRIDELENHLRQKDIMVQSLINDDFAELKKLKETHAQLTGGLGELYDKNIRENKKRFELFRKEFMQSMRKNMTIQQKIFIDRISLLTEDQKRLNSELQEKILKYEQLNESLKKTSTDLFIEKENNLILVFENEKYKQKISENKLQIDSLNELLMLEKEDLQKKKLTIITLEKEKADYIILTETLRSEISKLTEEKIHLNSQLIGAKTFIMDMNTKHILLVNDNTYKQRDIDEKIIEIIGLRSKSNELIEQLEKNQKIKSELNLKIDSLQFHIEELTKKNKELCSRSDELILNEKQLIGTNVQLKKELETTKTSFTETQQNLSTSLSEVQEDFCKEKEQIILEQKRIVKENNEKHIEIISKIKIEFETTSAEKDKKISLLMSHLKSHTESQYVTFNEIEKLKSDNSTLLIEQNNVDKRLKELETKHRVIIEELSISHKKDKEQLVKLHTQELTKLQSSHASLEARLEQSIQTLNISKTSIERLAKIKGDLEKTINIKETDEKTYKDKYESGKLEMEELKETLTQFTEINKKLVDKEHVYQLQIKKQKDQISRLINLSQQTQQKEGNSTESK